MCVRKIGHVNLVDVTVFSDKITECLAVFMKIIQPFIVCTNHPCGTILHYQIPVVERVAMWQKMPRPTKDAIKLASSGARS